MKINNYEFPESSFLSLEKDYALITEKIINNSRLLKLLWYDTKDALEKPFLSDKEKQEVIDKNIKIVPKIYIDNTLKTYLNINLDMFTPSENPEFRNNLIIFDIVCHNDVWQMKDFQMRPYKIAGELDFMFNKKHLTGIGNIEFVTCHQIPMNADYWDVCLIYRTYHGEEDQKGFLNPASEIEFEKFFDEAYNND